MGRSMDPEEKMERTRKCIMFVLDFGLVSGGANLTGLKGEGFGKMMG